MAKFYIQAQISKRADGTPALSPISDIMTGAQMKRYVAQTPMSVDAHLFELNEVSFTVEKKTISTEVDDLAIGAQI